MIESNQELELLEPSGLTNPPVSAVGDEHSAAQKCERFIAFHLGENIYCVPADMVAEVVHPLPAAVLPNSPRGVLGLAAVRGEIVAVLNLRELLEEKSAVPHGKSKMIVLKPRENQTQFGIPVDLMHEVMMFPSTAIQTADGANPAALARPMDYQGTVYRLIDPDKLSAEIALQL